MRWKRRQRTELEPEVYEEPKVASVEDVQYILASMIRGFEKMIAPAEELLVKTNNILRGLQYEETTSDVVDAALTSLMRKKLIFMRWSHSSEQEMYGPTRKLKWTSGSLLTKLYGMRRAMFWNGIDL